MFLLIWLAVLKREFLVLHCHPSQVVILHFEPTFVFFEPISRTDPHGLFKKGIACRGGSSSSTDGMATSPSSSSCTALNFSCKLFSGNMGLLCILPECFEDLKPCKTNNQNLQGCVGSSCIDDLGPHFSQICGLNMKVWF